MILSILCSKFFIPFILTWHCLCLYSFYPAEPLIVTEHVINMATRSKAGAKCKLLSVEENLHNMNKVDAT